MSTADLSDLTVVFLSYMYQYTNNRNISIDIAQVLHINTNQPLQPLPGSAPVSLASREYGPDGWTTWPECPCWIHYVYIAAILQTDGQVQTDIQTDGYGETNNVGLRTGGVQMAGTYKHMPGIRLVCGYISSIGYLTEWEDRRFPQAWVDRTRVVEHVHLHLHIGKVFS